MDFQKELHNHFEEDKKNFKYINEVLSAQEKDHGEFKKQLDAILESQTKTKEFMENMSGLNDFLKGAGLLRKPLMVLVGFIIALVAVMGGLKTIIGWFVIGK